MLGHTADIDRPAGKHRTRRFDLTFAIVADGLVALAGVVLWQRFGPPLILLPSLVFLALAGLLGAFLNARPGGPERGVIPWAVVGGLVGLNLFGVAFGLGIGGLAAPLWAAAIALGIGAVLADLRQARLRRWTPVYLVLAVIAGLAEYGLIALLFGIVIGPDGGM